MIGELVRIMEGIRNLSYSEWEELKNDLLKHTTQDEPKRDFTVEINEELYKTIKELGIPANMLGYKYIKKAVLLAWKDFEILKTATKRLYPTIAKEFGTTSSAVEAAIRHAIETAFERGNQEKLQEIFGWTYSQMKGKPTNTEFIAGIVDYIQNR